LSDVPSSPPRAAAPARTARPAPAERALAAGALLPLLALFVSRQHLGQPGAVDLPVALFLVATGVLAALPLLAPARRGAGPLWWRAAIAVCVCLACAAAARLPVESLTSPLLAQARGQGSLVVARAALLCGALLFLRLVPRRRRAALAALAAAAFVASWAVNAALLVLAASWALIALSGRRSAAPQATRPALAVVAAGLVLAATLALRPPPPPPPRSDAEAALSWEARDNPWRALPHARAWATSEGAPGPGLFCLGRVALRLGDLEEGRALIARVVSGAADEALRREAAAFLAATSGHRESGDAR
jgi:hypothetical protein